MKGEELKSVRTAYLFWLVGLCGCLGVGALADAFLLGWLVRRHKGRTGLRTLRRQLEETACRKREAVEAQRYEEAAGLRDREGVLQRYIKALRQRLGAA